MRILGDYLRYHKKAILLFFVCVCIFSTVFFLSRIPLDAVLYGGLLCLIAAGVIAAYDFRKYVVQHRQLQRLTEAIDAQIEDLPEPGNQIDEDYTEIIKELHRQKRMSESRAYVEKKELIDYFTLWAHQIKTPISAMGLLLQKKGAQAGEDGRQMSMELFNIEEYVDTAMSWVRARDISSDLMFEQVELDALIARVLKKYAALFIGRKIRVDFQKTGYTAATDEKWLFIVLGQILSNSLKYTPPGGSIFIWMEEEQLFIRDTGIGIRAEDLPRVFEKGFTGENGRQYSKSTGQGLYLCRLIMEKLSYGICAESEEGKGTMVILDLRRENFS